MKLSLYAQHRVKYAEGCGSEMCSTACKVVFAKGSVPCSVLFVGEHPGSSEDARGIPFDGPAGVLLDSWIKRSGMKGAGLTVGFYNLVSCMPKRDGEKKEPDADQIKKCRPKLKEFIELCKPRALVMVGSLAEKHVPAAIQGSVMFAGGKVGDHPTLERWLSLVHPAFVLRSVDAQQSLLNQKCVVQLANLVETLVGEAS